MRRVLDLDTSDTQFAGLHEALERTRRNGSTVTVDKEAFRSLLMDHSKIIAALREANITYTNT